MLLSAYFVLDKVLEKANNILWHMLLRGLLLGNIFVYFLSDIIFTENKKKTNLYIISLVNNKGAQIV